MRGSGSDASVQDDYPPLQVLEGRGSLYRTALTRRLGETSCSLDVPKYYAHPSSFQPRVPRQKLPRSDPVMSYPTNVTGPDLAGNIGGQRHHPAWRRMQRRAIGPCPPRLATRSPLYSHVPQWLASSICLPSHVGPLTRPDSDQPDWHVNSADLPGPLEHPIRGVPGDFARLQTGPPAHSGRARLICRGPRPSPSAAQIRGAAVHFRVFEIEDYADGYRPHLLSVGVRAC